MRIKIHLLILCVVGFFIPGIVFGQCGPGTPSFAADLSANPNAIWTSPEVSRNDNCCGSSNPDRCIKFIITLHPNATGINFNVVEGALPPGALYYQIGCGPLTPVGQPICLSGPGPHVLTFCKPGNNQNVYQIASIPPATGGNDVVINDGCTSTFHATGFDSTTVVWHSIYPGAPGAYNSYLSCSTNCLNPRVTGGAAPPAYIDYVICGKSSAKCNNQTICDTLRAVFNPTLHVVINPTNPTVCFGQTSTLITAIGSGGTPPYSYLWNNVNPSQSINVGTGVYTVKLSDASGCPPTYTSVTVTSYSVAITANAGSDDSVCIQNPIAVLHGAVTGASGGIWSGGAGVFTPNKTTLSGGTYTPTAAELANGFVDLKLLTTGNGSCPPDSDVVRINFLGFTGIVSVSKTDVSCYGGNNGTATAGVTGGVNPYTYLWNTAPAQSTSTASNLIQGSYVVTVKDGIGCTVQSTAVITQPTPLVLNSTVTNVLCFGGSSGNVVAGAVGGTTPYTYLWQPGSQTGSTAVNLSVGSYSVVVTDSKSCQKTASYIVTEPSQLTASLSITNVSCFGGSNGSILCSTAGGGAAPYTYSWSSIGASSPNVSGLTVGSYTVVVTDHSGCTTSAATTLTAPPALGITPSSTNETCDYKNNGTAMANASGGSPTYTYNWQPGGQTSSSVSNLSAGTSYSLTVSDAKGCSVSSITTITEPPALAINLLNITNVSCFGGNNGAVTANASGGSSAYNYLWSPGSATTSTVNNLTAGSYTVTVTDINGCTLQNSVTITQPLLALSVNTSSTAVSCHGGTNGAATALASGGTAPYTYNWPGNFTGATISNLSAGTYTVTATDAHNCSITNTIAVTEPATLALTPGSVNSTCSDANGQAFVSVAGGVSPFTYQWSPSGGTGQTASGLLAGSYVVTVTDNKSCTANVGITVNNTSGPTAIISGSTNVSCNGGSNGTTTVIPSGGTIPFTYLWSPSGGTNATATGLIAGTYTVTVRDANACQTVAITPAITQPLAISISTTTTNASCFGGNSGAVSSTVTGGTPVYNYLWTPGSATTASVNNLLAGSYTLSVTDNNGCKAQKTVSITQPLAISATPSSTPVSCHGGSNGTLSSLTASGGTPAYTYNWQPGNYTGQNISNVVAGTYTLTTEDSKGCVSTNTISVTEPVAMVLNTATLNSSCSAPDGQASVTISSGGAPPFTYLWSPVGGTGPTATGLYSGSYMVVVTDVNGCSVNATGNISNNGGPTTNISSLVNVTCHGGSNGSASVNAVGGTLPYAYSWSPSGGTGATASGLIAGNYVVTVTDANNCQSVISTNPVITEPPAITISTTVSSVSCFGGNNGSATVSASGGVPGYTYTWLPGGSTGNTITGLSANTYTVKVTDANSCVQTATYIINQAPLLTSSITASSNVSCNGGNNGTATVGSLGGTPFYNYNWAPTGGNSSVGAGLTNGTYTVTTTDSKGCTSITNVTITEPPAITLTPASINSSCGKANGQASVSVAGGVSPYNYQWQPTGGTNSIASGLLAATYNVSVSDNNGCPRTIAVTINNTQGPTALISSVTNVSCKGGSNGSATVTPAGGTIPYSYLWSPSGGTNAIASGLSVGMYMVTVSDVNGCQTVTTTSAITEPTAIVVTTSSVASGCFGGSSGTASVSASGGIPGYNYTWFPSGTTNASISGLSSGTYTVQVSDANSCVKTSTLVIGQPSPMTVSIGATTNVSCFGGNNGTSSAVVTGGTTFYNYNWLPSGGNGPAAVGLAAGSYTVNVTDAKGCTQSSSVTITQPVQALSVIASSVPVTCSGGTNGSASAIVTGGTPGYSFNWSPSGGTGQTASGLSAGNYIVQITDLKGCQTSVATGVPQPIIVVNGTLLPVNPSCGLSNGSITSQISGGTGPYSYSWTPGGYTTSAISGVGPGSYTLNVTDASCSVKAVLTVTLTNIAGPTAVAALLNNASCATGNDGAATVNVTNGTAPYTFSWSPYGGSTLSGTSLIAGTYTVNVKDALGCTATSSVIITEPLPLSFTPSSITPVSCKGGNNGAISVAASGGTPAYTYSWAPVVASSATVNNLTAGTYTLTVLDNKNCKLAKTINVSEPLLSLSSSISSSVDPLCHGGSGSATILSNGGSIPYSYLWSTSPVQNGSTATLTGGTYTVTTTDSHGCISTTPVVVNDPTQVITVAGLNDTICLGQTATLTATALGGAGNYNFAWQPSGAVNSGTLNLSPLVMTTYTVIAYDNNGCAGTDAEVRATVYTLKPADVNAVAYSPICPGQSTSIYVQVSGITGPLTYQWSNGLGTGPGTYVITPSQPTTYIVTVTNITCSSSVIDSAKVLFNPPPTVSLSSDTNFSCIPYGMQFFDNSITGNLTDPITSWYWTFGDGTASTLPDPKHAYTSPGAYSVKLTVTTAGGCTNNNTSAPLLVNVYPSPKANFTTNPSVNPMLSNNPIVQFDDKSTGATTYFWDFGDGSTSVMRDPNHQYPIIGNYMITFVATNKYGCSDTIRLKTSGEGGIIFPNAFTPNPNGPNGGAYDIFNRDNYVFFPFAVGVDDFHMTIFNRWGELVFETFDIKKGWDGYYHGTLCQQEVYVWKASVKFLDGKTETKVGDVTLLR